MQINLLTGTEATIATDQHNRVSKGNKTPLSVYKPYFRSKTYLYTTNAGDRGRIIIKFLLQYMKKQKPGYSYQNKFRGKVASLFRGNRGIILRFALTGLFISLAVWFFNHEKTELHSVSRALFGASPVWL